MRSLMLRAWRAAIADKASGLDHRVRLVALAISLHMTATGEGADPSQDTIAGETGLNKRQVRDATAVLVERGWMHVTPGRRGRGQSSKYRALIPAGFVPEASWKARVFASVYGRPAPVVQLSLLELKGTNGKRKGTTVAPEVFSSEVSPPTPPQAGGDVIDHKPKRQRRRRAEGTSDRQVAARREVDRLTERIRGCGADHCRPPRAYCTRCANDRRAIGEIIEKHRLPLEVAP